MKSKCANFAKVHLTISTNKRHKHFSKKTLVFLETEQDLILLFATSYINNKTLSRCPISGMKVGSLAVKVQVTSDLRLHFLLTGVRIFPRTYIFFQTGLPILERHSQMWHLMMGRFIKSL